MKEDENSRIWYFAYGSNMDPSRMAQRICRSIKGRRALLNGWSLAFDKVGSADGEGFANIHPFPEKSVWGVLYEITEKELLALDHFEGVPRGEYRRERVRVDTEELGNVEAVVYVSTRCAEKLKPRAKYLRYLLRGAKEHGIPENYIKLLATIPSLK